MFAFGGEGGGGGGGSLAMGTLVQRNLPLAEWQHRVWFAFHLAFPTSLGLRKHASVVQALKHV